MLKEDRVPTENKGQSWSWSYGSWIYNYVCNQCISPLKLWISLLFRRGVLDTILCNIACQRLVTGRWCSLGTSVSSTNKTGRDDITELFLKVALSTTTLTLNSSNLLNRGRNKMTLTFNKSWYFVILCTGFNKYAPNGNLCPNLLWHSCKWRQIKIYTYTTLTFV